MSTRFDLDEKEWALIEPLLPTGMRGARRVDDRRVMNGIFYVLRAGCPWRDLPARYGPYTTCYNGYNRWTKRGVWKQIFDTLARRSKHSLHMRSTVPSSGPIERPAAQKGGTGPMYWPLTRRSHDEAPCHGRWIGATARLRLNGRRGS